MSNYVTPGEQALPFVDLPSKATKVTAAWLNAVQGVAVDIAGASGRMVAVEAGVAATALDSAVVHNTGAETIAGIKTFSAAPVVPSGAFPESAVANLTTDLAAKVTSVSAGDGTVTVGGTATAPTVKLGTVPESAVTNLTADLAGKAASVHTHAEADVTNLTTDLAAKLAKASNLSDLTSASTARTNLGLAGAAVLAVGATTGTVAAGDDSRVVGAAALITPTLPTATYFYPISPTSTSTSNTLGNGTARVAPWVVTRAISLARIGADVATIGDVGSKFRLMIYADNGAGFPGALILDAGQIAGDSATMQELTISQTLQPGLYWLGGAVQSAPTTQPTMRILGGHTPQALIGAGGTLPAANGNVVGYTGAAAGAAPGTFATGSVGSGSAPRVFLRTA